MKSSEQAAFNAGIAYASEMARITAVTIETRDDTSHLRQQAAATTLHDLAESLKEAAGSNSRSSGGSVPAHSPLSTASRATAIAQQAFTDDTCDTCGSPEMKRSGTCMTCQSCGSTTGWG